MDKRIFVIGDIHGAYKALNQVLDRANLKKDDRLIFLGDYVDGWSESSKVIQRLIELSNTHDCLFIRGNHDALFQEWLETKTENRLWLRNGGGSTIASYNKFSKAELDKHHMFLSNLQNYYIDDDQRLFVHGGFTKLSGPKNEYYDYVFYWDRTLWETAVATDPNLAKDDPRFPERFTHFKEIFIGHTPVTRLGETKPFKALNVWNADTGAGFDGPLSMLEVNTKEVIQSDPVKELYPNEQGRN